MWTSNAARHAPVTVAGQTLADAETEVSLHKVPGRSAKALEQVLAAVANNGYDEVVFRSGRDLYVLQGKSFPVAKEGSQIAPGAELVFGDLQGTVLHVDDETLSSSRNKLLGAAGFSAIAFVGPLLTALLGMTRVVNPEMLTMTSTLWLSAMACFGMPGAIKAFDLSKQRDKAAERLASAGAQSLALPGEAQG